MKIVFLILKLYGVWFVAWVVGCVINTAYCYATATDFSFKGVNYGHNAKSSSIESVAFTFPVAVVTFPFIYAPMMFGLRWLLGGVKPSFLFLIVATALTLFQRRI